MNEREKDKLASFAKNLTALIDEAESLRLDLDNAHWLIRAVLLASGGQIECKPEHYREAKENKALTHGYGTGGVVLHCTGADGSVVDWIPPGH